MSKKNNELLIPSDKQNNNSDNKLQVNTLTEYGFYLNILITISIVIIIPICIKGIEYSN